MALDFTDRWGLPIPSLTDPPDGPDQLGDLARSLDDHAKDDQGTRSAMPNASVAGRGKWFYVVEEGRLYRSDGSQWGQIPMSNGGWPKFWVSRTTLGESGEFFQYNAAVQSNAWAIITFTTAGGALVRTDSHGGWNAVNNRWIVPVTGTYYLEHGMDVYSPIPVPTDTSSIRTALTTTPSGTVVPLSGSQTFWNVHPGYDGYNSVQSNNPFRLTRSVVVTLTKDTPLALVVAVSGSSIWQFGDISMKGFLLPS